MKKCILIVLTFTLLLTGGCHHTPRASRTKSENVARQATDAFVERADSEFYLQMSADLKSRMSLHQLSNEFDSLIQMYGQPLEISAELPESSSWDNRFIVRVPVRFQNGWMDFEYTIDADGSIVAFQVLASDMLDENGYDEIRGTYTVENIDCTYIYTRPNNTTSHTPIVLLVHGSDALDRNSTVNATRVFRSLAYRLADEGIATIRFDRTVYNHPEIDDTPEQIRKELSVLVSQLRTDEVIKAQRFYILGYGLGGYLLPYYASGLRAYGYIIANAPSERFGQCLYDKQVYVLNWNPLLSDAEREEKLQQAEASRDIINNIRTADDYKYDLFGYSSAFWAFMNSYDSISALRVTSKPVMIVQGDNDYEISSDQFANWESKLVDKDNICFKYYKNMDHLLEKRTSPSNPDDSKTPGTIHPAFLKDLVEFVENN